MTSAIAADTEDPDPGLAVERGGAEDRVHQRQSRTHDARLAPAVAGKAVDRDRLVEAVVPVAAEAGDDLLDGESVVVALRTGVEGAGVRQLVRPGSRPWGPRPRAR
jgi:hypothetical protein